MYDGKGCRLTAALYEKCVIGDLSLDSASNVSSRKRTVIHICSGNIRIITFVKGGKEKWRFGLELM